MNRLNRIVARLNVYKDNVFLCIIDVLDKIFEHKYSVVIPDLYHMNNDMQKY